jgi:hypothetical protein
MRMAFLSAGCVWFAALAAEVFLPGTIVVIALVAVALALSLLWLAHLVAYAARRARCAARTPSVDRAGTITRYRRRDIFPLFARTLALAALATALPAVFSAARADDDGGCQDDTPYACDGNYCCAAPAQWYCQGYTGTYDPWLKLGTFCTNANSDEAVADLRSNCALLVSC